MSDIERDDDAEEVGDLGDDEGGVGSVTPQAEVSGNDPAGFEVSGAGEESGGQEPSGGVGDWNPADAGGGGGEVY